MHFFGAPICLPVCLLADFGYDESTRITGGAPAGMMKFARAFSKAALEPLQFTVALKGNRMFHGDKDRATAIDLDAEKGIIDSGVHPAPQLKKAQRG